MAQAREAGAEDLGHIYRLLERAGLPTSDLALARPQFIVLVDGEAIVAAGALERFESAALLRSVVVAADRRGTGLGKLLVAELEHAAARAGIERLVLLTQTAADFFVAQGYRILDRSQAPVMVRESREFSSLCPSSATCMVKVLGKQE